VRSLDNESSCYVLFMICCEYLPNFAMALNPIISIDPATFQHRRAVCVLLKPADRRLKSNIAVDSSRQPDMPAT